MNNDIKKLLKVHQLGVVVYGTKWEDNENLVVKVGHPVKSAECSYCGTRSTSRHQKGDWRKVLHQPDVGGYRVFLRIRKDRYWCEICERTFTEEFDFLPKGNRITTKAEEEILRLLKRHSFSYLEEEYQIGYRTAVKALEKYVSPEAYDWGPFLGTDEEIILGLDQHSFAGREMVTTITNLTAGEVVAIVPNERKEDIKKALQELPEEIKERVVEVCIDMDRKLRNVVKESLPNAQVVVDHFHVIQNANQRIDEARRIEQEELEGRRAIPKKIWLANEEDLQEGSKCKLEKLKKRYPTVALFHWVKEELRKIYACKSREQAERKLTDLIIVTSKSYDVEITLWSKMLSRWKYEILAFFDRRTTNAYTEGAHTKMKLIKRISYGFKKVMVYVRKVLLCFLPMSIILSNHT